jgi:L-asparaginase II
VVVCNSAGRLLASAGDPDRIVFARSAMKPLQAAVSARLTGEDLPDEELALMCASHNGEPVHVETVHRLLDRAAIRAEPVAVGVDGCGVPVHAMPLRSMSTLFARLPVIDEQSRKAGVAMRACPYLVAGRDRLDNAVMDAIDGVIGVAELGALEHFASPPVLGGGEPVGAMTSDFSLARTH